MSIASAGGIVATMPLHKPTVFWSAVGTVGFLAFALWLPILALRFRQLFADLGVRLPQVTSLVVVWRLQIALGLTVIALFQVFALSKYVARREESLLRVVWLLFSLDIVVVAGIIFCFYLPIEQLGSPV